MIKTLDIRKSIKAANGNITLARELFTMLLDDLAVKEAQINTCIKQNDLKSLKELTHKLFGATAYCIAPELRITTEKLEQRLKLHHETELEHMIDNLQKVIKEILSEGPLILSMDWETY